MARQKMARHILIAAVKRMLELGLAQETILKIFALYETDPIIETLKHYKYVTVKIPEEFFIKKIKDKAGCISNLSQIGALH